MTRMQIFEVRTPTKIEFFTSQTAATRFAWAQTKKTIGCKVTCEVLPITFELTKKGVNKLCRELCVRHFPDEDVQVRVGKAIRITAARPPVPEEPAGDSLNFLSESEAASLLNMDLRGPEVKRIEGRRREPGEGEP